jgi:hypothetical protein
MTAIAYAVERGAPVDAVAALLAAGARAGELVPGTPGAGVHYPLLVAAAMRRGSGATIRLLLDHGVDPDATLDGRWFSPLPGGTALMLAAAYGHSDAVAALLRGGADVGARDSSWRTAVDHGLRAPCADVIVVQLVAAGAALPSLRRLPRWLQQAGVGRRLVGEAAWAKRGALLRLRRRLLQAAWGDDDGGGGDGDEAGEGYAAAAWAALFGGAGGASRSCAAESANSGPAGERQ